jgi:glycine hydroxymethyltransferase
MAGRYAGRPESYGGSRFFHEIWKSCELLACEVFRCESASVAPISGHVAGMMALDAVTKRGDKVAVVSSSNGGYRGYNQGLIPDVMGLDVIDLPYEHSMYNINLEGSLELILEQKPSAVVLGGTVFLFPFPLKEICETVHSYGGKVVYDGSHVLGLIAGRKFQDPLGEGADVLLGSTHKTLFGPQGGIILSNDRSVISRIEDRFLYRFIDNFHLNRVAALGIALEETKKHRDQYAKKVVSNSKELAGELYSRGLPVAAKEFGFTESHQVLLTYGSLGATIRDVLDSNSIICDSRVRLGTNEVTRRGMGSKEMKAIAALVAEAVPKENQPSVVRKVRSLLSRFRQVKYSLEN